MTQQVGVAMCKKQKTISNWIWIILFLLLLSLGLSLGLNIVKREDTYFVFLNIISIAYTVAGTLTIIILRKHLKVIPVALMLGNYVLSFGQIYFLQYKTYHRLLIFLFVLSILYLMFYLINFFIFQKRRLEAENIHLINPIMPIFIIGGSILIKMFLALHLIKTEIGTPLLSFLMVALGCAAVALIIALLLIKNRKNKGEYFGKLAGVFFATMVLAFAIPAFTTEYVNFTFDPSAGEMTECVVVEKHAHVGNGKSGPNYRLIVRINESEIDLNTQKIVYSQYEPGDTLRLYKHEGALGYPYYEYRLDTIFDYEG